jgi:hypothetical protein
MTISPAWYVVKQENGQCTIVPTDQLPTPQAEASQPESWGPFESQTAAIARRVGLIRAGKCQPA